MPKLEYYDGTEWILVNKTKSVMQGYVANSYSQDVDTGDHFKFNAVEYSQGDLISLDTSSAYTSNTNVNSVGRITLQGGYTYKLTASLNNLDSANRSANPNQWYNADTNVSIGLLSIIPTPRYNRSYAPSATVAFFATLIETRIELRIMGGDIDEVNGQDDNEGPSWFIVEQI